jgi:hypothetical protein
MTSVTSAVAVPSASAGTRISGSGGLSPGMPARGAVAAAGRPGEKVSTGMTATTVECPAGG